jgi:hypothetical protein
MIAKKYNVGMKENAYTLLCDTGYFTNKFKVEVLEENILPWLTKKVMLFVKEIDELNKFPDELMGSYFEENERIHKDTVKAEK